MSEIKPVNSFISNITIARIPSENSIEPINLPQVLKRVKESKNAVPPIPIITPEQKDIKQKDINCALVNFSKDFIIFTVFRDITPRLLMIIMQTEKNCKLKSVFLKIVYKKILKHSKYLPFFRETNIMKRKEIYPRFKNAQNRTHSRFL